MQTTFDHTFRADLMKSNIFLYEQDATNALKCFSDRFFWTGQRAKHFQTLVAMEQANAICRRTQDLVGREEATIVVRKLTVAQLREQQQGL